MASIERTLVLWGVSWALVACGTSALSPQHDQAGSSSAVPPAGTGTQTNRVSSTGAGTGGLTTPPSTAGIGAPIIADAGVAVTTTDAAVSGASVDAATPTPATDAAISDVPADAGANVPSGTGYLHTRGSQLLDSQNEVVRITGISWFGMETSNFAPHGLWVRPLTALLDQIKQLGYNTLRLPYCSQLFDTGSIPNGVDAAMNPELTGLGGLALMDKIVAEAGKRGLKVILDRHRPDANAQSELWYTDQYSEQRLIDDWKMLAAHYKGNSTVVGFDLHNEPRGAATWGDGNMATDWRLAAERIGNAVLAVNADLLIIVEGIEKYKDTSGWWGANLRGAKDNPVRLSVANRLVYSAHDYPQSVFAQPWFSAPDYPNNLPAVWREAWGYLAEERIAPVWVGELGTKYQTQSDKQWLQALVDYVKRSEISFAYWSLNPNSGDTGGILQDDWSTVNTDKQAVMQPALAPLLP